MKPTQSLASTLPAPLHAVIEHLQPDADPLLIRPLLALVNNKKPALPYYQRWYQVHPEVAKAQCWDEAWFTHYE